MSVVLALQNLRRGHKRIPCSQNDAPARSRGTWQKICLLKNLDKSTFYSTVEAGAVGSRHPTVAMTANGEVQTFEEAKMQLLDETPAVLSLGKLCEDHGYSYEWVSGQKPRLTKEGKTITCKIDNHVPLVVPGWSANPGSSSSSKLPLRDQSSTDLSEEQRKMIAYGNGSDQSPKNPKPKTMRNTREMRMIDCEIFQSGWSRSQIISKMQKLLHPHKFIKTQIRNGLRKWQKSQGSIVFLLTSQNAEMRRLLENQTNKGSLRKTHWRSSTTRRKVW